MDAIGSALGNGVDHTTRRASVFSRVVGGVDLELLHCNLRSGIASTRATALFRKVRLVVISAVNGDVVEQGAHSAEADQTKTLSVANHAGRQEDKAGPATTVDGKVFNRGFIQCWSKIT